MRNKVHYIKPQNNDFAEAVRIGFMKALQIIAEKNISNLKFVITGMDQLDAPNHISAGLDKILNNKGGIYTKILKKDRSFSIPQYPTDDQTTGVNLVLLNSNPTFSDHNTVVLLIWGDYDSFKKLESILFNTEIELVVVVYNENQPLNELLSSTNAQNISGSNDSNVTPYINTFSEQTNNILRRLLTINVTSFSSNTHTRETMKNVIDDLKDKKLVISYLDFLGFLVNEVNFPLQESVGLLHWKRSYFNR